MSNLSLRYASSRGSWGSLFPNIRIVQIFLLMVDAHCVYINQPFKHQSEKSFSKWRCRFYWQFNFIKVWLWVVLTSRKKHLPFFALFLYLGFHLSQPRLFRTPKQKVKYVQCWIIRFSRFTQKTITNYNWTFKLSVLLYKTFYILGI